MLELHIRVEGAPTIFVDLLLAVESHGDNVFLPRYLICAPTDRTQEMYCNEKRKVVSSGVNLMLGKIADTQHSSRYSLSLSMQQDTIQGVQ